MMSQNLEDQNPIVTTSLHWYGHKNWVQVPSIPHFKKNPSVQMQPPQRQGSLPSHWVDKKAVAGIDGVSMAIWKVLGQLKR